MQMDVIREQLKQLRLPSAMAELEMILQKRKVKSDIAWLSELLESELDARKQSALERRMKRASFPERTSLEQFNWGFNKKIPREQIENLASCKFVEQNEIVLLLGTPGTGKTHIAVAIGMRAAQLGHSVYCTSIKRLGTKIKIAKERNTLDVFTDQLSSPYIMAMIIESFFPRLFVMILTVLHLKRISDFLINLQEPTSTVNRK